MPEQLFNNFSTTMVDLVINGSHVGYVAGQGYLLLNSVSGLPSTGTFTLMLSLGNNQTVLFRVATVDIANKKVYGAAEGTDVSIGQSAPVSVYGPILSAAAIAQIKQDANTDDSWHAVTWQNSWSDFGSGFETVGYRKEGDRVFLRGLATAGNVTHSWNELAPEVTLHGSHINQQLRYHQFNHVA